ncbi:MAG: 30S ribosomal protein S2 [Patescibacteria group bacterium]|nr:30S ribosomal protein S2 [Patescibacteria group bacterium]MDE2589697.1 30S ribosomal protein S2 [Patescibacteria group bacterium]
MKEITLEELLEAGCHFGHQVTRQNPKARDFVFEARDNIHIIDLAKTKEGLDESANFVKELAKQGGTLVVVGSKRQAAPIIVEEVKRVKDTLSEKHINPNLFTVTARWIGGTLTNMGEVTKNYKRLRELESMLKDDIEKAKYTKKEVGMWEKERAKLEIYYGGIADMKERPQAMFVVDTHLENLAVREAIRTGVKTVGIVDTNADPSIIDYVIPANDDAVGSLKLLISHILNAWMEGKEEAAKVPVKKEEKEEVVAPAEAKEEKKESKPKVKKTVKKIEK